MSDQDQNSCQAQAEIWIGPQHTVRNRIHPARPVEKILIKPLVGHQWNEIAYSILPSLGAQRMIDSLASQAILLEPCARAPVKQHDACRAYGALQALVQKVAKQLMVTIPAPVAVQAHEKEVGSIKVIQLRLCIVLASNCSAERPTQARQDRCLHEEGLHLIWLVLKHLIGQIIEHVSVAASKTGEKDGDLRSVLVLQRQHSK